MFQKVSSTNNRSASMSEEPGRTFSDIGLGQDNSEEEKKSEKVPVEAEP
jgi:hypothetical protein